MYQKLDLEKAKSEPGYWYLATPYSKYPYGIQEAFIDACMAAGWLIKQGIRVYSPIGHTHPVAHYAKIDPLDHAIWLPVDLPLMSGACGLIICKMESWKDSYGIQQEIKEFQAAGKPVYELDWPQEGVRLHEHR